MNHKRDTKKDIMRVNNTCLIRKGFQEGNTCEEGE